MADHFRETAERMHEGSKQLFGVGVRHHQLASYLAGYVAECYLKIILEESGQTVQAIRNYARRQGGSGHTLSVLEQMQSTITVNASIAASGMGLLTASTHFPQLAAHWDPGKRYEPPTPWPAPKPALFQDEQTRCFDEITRLYVDGLIR